MGQREQFQHIGLEVERDFSILTLRRAERRNALSESVLAEVREALRCVAEGRTRGLVVAAEGPVFCSGHDFGDMQGRDLEGMRRILALCAEVMQAIQALPQPVVAQVEGLATAAGCQLVATCDLAVASEGARFAVPGGRGGWFCTTPGVALARAVPRKRALEMLLCGDPIDAATAQAWGLVNRVVPAGRVAQEARALLASATRGSSLSKAIGKQAFYRQVDLEIAEAYAYASEVMAASSQVEDAQENLQAFLEKRPARFQGR